MNAIPNWTPPDRLGYSSMRDVRLTGQGIALAVAAAVLVTGGFALGIFLERTARRQAEAQRLLGEQGITVDAVVTRRWRDDDKSRTPRLEYRFDYQGGIHVGSVEAPLEQWRELPEGAKLAVRFVPSQPAISHPAAWRSDVLPAWFPYSAAAAVAAFGMILLLSLLRQSRLLAEGRPAAARVTEIKKSNKGTVLRYEFRAPDGATVKGRAFVSQDPAAGTPLCILYDPENPRRNGLYPLPLVRLA